MTGELCGLAAAACWAGGSLLFSRIGRTTAPEVMNLGKSIAAGSLLVLTAIVLGWRGSMSGVAFGWLFASALAGITVGDTAYFGALVRLGLAPAVLLLSSAPVFTAMGGWVFLGESLDANEAAGIAAVTAGIALVVTAPASELSADARRTGRWGAGVALGLLAALGQAGGSLLSKQAMLSGVGPAETGGLRLLLGGTVLGLVLVARSRVAATVRELTTGRRWLRIAGASMLGSYAGIWLAQVAISRAKTTGIAATLLATSPICALPIARLAGETIRLRAVAGALLGVGGVALLTLGDAILGR